MSADAALQVRDIVDGLYRSDSRRILATLIRVLGDFELAEEALHDAFAAALEQWNRDGVPRNRHQFLAKRRHIARLSVLWTTPCRSGMPRASSGTPCEKSMRKM